MVEISVGRVLILFPQKGYAPGPALPQGGFAVDWEKMFQMYATTGYQAASLADAVAEVNRMVRLPSRPTLALALPLVSSFSHLSILF